MRTQSAMPDADTPADADKPVTVSVAWFHSGLAYRFGAYPQHRDEETPKELREAAAEWEKYRNWRCRKGRPLLLDVKQGEHATFDDAVVQELYRVLRMKYMRIDSLHFDVVPETTR